MTKIAIFDSGFGSLSIIKPIQRITKSEIYYFADQANFPYGKKSKLELRKIICNSLNYITKKYQPDLIIIGSNTPTLLLENITSKKILGVLPPLKQAEKISKTKNIAILATESVIKSKELQKFIKKNSKQSNVIPINASNLVNLVESGKFLYNKNFCKKQIIKLEKIFQKNNIDVATLSSTHLPFLRNLFEEIFPNVVFLDPANDIANLIKKISKSTLQRNKLKIFSSDKTKNFEKHLNKFGIDNKITYFSV